MAKLVKKILAEKSWEITAKTLTGLIVLQGPKIIAPLLSKGEGIFAPVMGWERYKEHDVDPEHWVCPRWPSSME